MRLLPWCRGDARGQRRSGLLSATSPPAPRRLAGSAVPSSARGPRAKFLADARTLSHFGSSRPRHRWACRRWPRFDAQNSTPGRSASAVRWPSRSRPLPRRRRPRSLGDLSEPATVIVSLLTLRRLSGRPRGKRSGVGSPPGPPDRSPSRPSSTSQYRRLQNKWDEPQVHNTAL